MYIASLEDIEQANPCFMKQKLKMILAINVCRIDYLKDHPPSIGRLCGLSAGQDPSCRLRLTGSVPEVRGGGVAGPPVARPAARHQGRRRAIRRL